MKSIFYPILILFILSTHIAHTQIQLNATQWQEDLIFLQNTIHKDYSLLFQKITMEEFDASVKQLHDEIPDMDTHEIIVGFAKTVAQFKIGHTAMPIFQGGSNGNESSTDFTRLPFNLYHFNDGVFVQGVHSDYKQILGAKVMRIGDKTIDDEFTMKIELIASQAVN